MKVINVAGASASVSELDLCSLTLALAIGSECGTVRFFSLCMCSLGQSTILLN